MGDDIDRDDTAVEDPSLSELEKPEVAAQEPAPSAQGAAPSAQGAAPSAHAAPRAGRPGGHASTG